ncbi:MAG: hypothetical protein QW638_06450 [Candidatus Bathyarchaeia archaeon]|nr:hypothetical protein [Candidatus Bathyarchaeota archaeon]
MSQETIWDRLQRIDRRVIYWILFILLMVPFLRPLSLPVSIGPQSITFIEGLRKLKEGDVVVINISSGVSAWPECLPSLVAVSKVLIQQKAKMIFWTSFVDGHMTFEKIVEKVPGFKGLTYGVDYVHLGFYTGAEPAVAQLAKNIRAIFTTDYKGTPIDQLPIMKNVNSANDVKMVISSDTGDYCDYYIRQWRIPFGVPLAEIGIAMNFSAYQPHWQAGILFGVTAGARGGAELEKLIGEPGDATITMDSINTSHLLVIVAVILANLGYAATRRKK